MPAIGTVNRLRRASSVPFDGQHFLGLAVAETDLAGTVTDHHERSERETTTALDDLGDSVDVDDADPRGLRPIARVVVRYVRRKPSESVPAASASAATRPW